MITDNSSEQRQIDWLADQDAQRLLVASGYFEPRIWRNPRTGDGISDSLRDLKEFKLLLGSKPSSDVGQAGMEYLDLGAQVNLEAKALAEKFLSDQGLSPDEIDTLRVLNRLEFTRRRGGNENKYFEVTVRGAIFGETAMKIRNENPENKMNALLVSQLFAEEMVVDVDLDEPNAVIDALLEKKLIEEHLRDDGYVYYRPSNDGLLVLKEGQEIIKDGDVSMVEYAKTGTDVVAARGGVEVFPLHWDDMYDNDVPLIDAIYDALDTRKPKQDNGLNKALEEAVSRAASIFREPPTASQLKSVAAELLKNEGVEFEAAQLDHAATTYRMANNDHNKAPSPKP